jgi:chemotaxis protein methyltransferase CheR
MISNDEFRFLAELLKKRSGIALTEDKHYLLESRLLPIARSINLADISQLCQKVRTQPTEELITEIVEAMTTNESSFFRDIKPYENLRNIAFPMLTTNPMLAKRMRIWSAACSTGQEAYTIAMCIREDAAKMPGWLFDIVGTDLAKKVVDKAKLGIYSQFEAQRGLPIQMLIKYFNSLPDTSWQLKDDVRSMVDFKTNNLLDDYTRLGKFDIIFCRNVLIYFDHPTKSVVLENMSKQMTDDAVLYLGGAETVLGISERFKPIPSQRGVYAVARPGYNGPSIGAPAA